MDRGGAIGYGGKLPWDWKRLPADMKRFRELTMEKPVIMGRKTLESIGKPLAGRWNIVISSQKVDVPSVIWARSPEDAVRIADYCGDATEAMVIGGAEVYRQFLPIADRMYLTIIDAVFSGDRFFPAYEVKEWRTTRRILNIYRPESSHELTFLDLEFLDLERRNPR